MSTISFGGLATGLDTQSIITQLMNLERAPEQLLQAQQKKNTGKISEFQKIEDALSSLQDVVQGFNTPATFNAVKSTVGNSSALSATATSSATQGTHTVQVVSLAKFQRQVSTGVASDTALSFGTGSFTIDGGAPISPGDGSVTLRRLACTQATRHVNTGLAGGLPKVSRCEAGHRRDARGGLGLGYRRDGPNRRGGRTVSADHRPDQPGGDAAPGAHG